MYLLPFKTKKQLRAGTLVGSSAPAGVLTPLYFSRLITLHTLDPHPWTEPELRQRLGLN